MNSRLPVPLMVLVLLMVVLSSGCINSVQAMLSGSGTNGGLPYEDDYPSGIPLVPGPDGPAGAAAALTPAPSPAATLVVEEVSPDPYVTTDPYRFPYRDHGNWSTVEALRIEKIPQYSKSFVLRSNSTAVRVDAPEAPVVIDLVFSPLYDNPDQTTGASGSYIHSKALVTVHQENSSAIVEQDGFGCGYSTAKEKKITLYREGTFVIALSGDFMDVKMEVTSGAGADKPPVTVPDTIPSDGVDEYW